MIDLHTHTTYSDGKDDVTTLLKKAESMGIEYLSITDHSTCKAYEEIKNIDIKKYYTGKLITGCELYTTMYGTTIELLGYNVDTEFLNTELPNVYKYSKKDIALYEAEKLIKICDELGIFINKDNLKSNPGGLSAHRIFHSEITKYDENKKIFDNERAWKHAYVFYRECICNPNSKFFIEKDTIYPSPNEVIKLIKKSGGLVFIAHTFVYGENSIKIFDGLTQNYDIDGIECYYTLFSQEQTEFLLNFCKKNNYYMSGGSDYHGSLKPDFHLGKGKGNLNINYDVIKDWVNKSL